MDPWSVSCITCSLLSLIFIFFELLRHCISHITQSIILHFTFYVKFHISYYTNFPFAIHSTAFVETNKTAQYLHYLLCILHYCIYKKYGTWNICSLYKFLWCAVCSTTACINLRYENVIVIKQSARLPAIPLVEWAESRDMEPSGIDRLIVVVVVVVGCIWDCCIWDWKFACNQQDNIL